MSGADATPQGTRTISLANEEAVKKVVADSILGLWDVVNNLTRLQPSRRDRYRVTIFGSARAKPGMGHRLGDAHRLLGPGWGWSSRG